MTPAMTPRKNVATYGARGSQVRVFVERGGDLVRVQWRERGIVRTKSWANTTAGVKDARAWAKAFADTRDRPSAAVVNRITLREMWDAYVVAEFPHLREKTKVNYSERWADWERFAGRNLVADLTTQEMLDQYRERRTKLGLSVAQTGQYIQIVKQVYRWALQRELITKNRVILYRFKVAKEERTVAPAEYQPGDFGKLLAQFDPRSSYQWRAWGITAISGTQGPRSNAVRHLKWSDVDFNARTIRWAPEFDKLGRERVQPLTPLAIDALYVALGWAVHDGETSGWVFYSPTKRKRAEGGAPVSAQGYWQQLRDAEDASGVGHIERRSAHGLRRMAAGNALEVTGNIAEAMWWIGDTDLRQGKKYLKTRDERMEFVAGHDGMGVRAGPSGPEESPASIPATVTKPQSQSETQTAPQSPDAVSDDTATACSATTKEPQIGIEPMTARVNTVAEDSKSVGTP